MGDGQVARWGEEGRGRLNATATLLHPQADSSHIHYTTHTRARWALMTQSLRLPSIYGRLRRRPVDGRRRTEMQGPAVGHSVLFRVIERLRSVSPPQRRSLSLVSGHAWRLHPFVSYLSRGSSETGRFHYSPRIVMRLTAPHCGSTLRLRRERERVSERDRTTALSRRNRQRAPSPSVYLGKAELRRSAGLREQLRRRDGRVRKRSYASGRTHASMRLITLLDTCSLWPVASDGESRPAAILRNPRAGAIVLKSSSSRRPAGREPTSAGRA
uniref:Uncharacterized protein n=1 Tax=Plectus sambesii TaxID=2011161 RepID=A0A914VJJ3_9BILA